MDGQAVAAQLMIELCGARLVAGHGRRRRAGPGAEDAARCATRRSRGLLGTEVPLGEQAELLERLEFGVVDERRRARRHRPAFRRNDVTREVDLIEEVARLWGLEKLPVDAAPRHGARGRLDASSRGCAAARGDALVGAGFSRGDRLELPGAGDGAAAADLDAPAVDAAQPAVRGPVR